MPYIKTTTNTPIPEETRAQIKTQLGRDASILGKTEGWLMVDFCERSALYFQGTDEPAALVSIDLYGASGAAAYDRMTAAITRLLGDKLGIPADRVFVKYQEYAHWGWNGHNF